MDYTSESIRRIERKIARAKIKHMSKTKWRKLFAALHALPQAPKYIGIKLIGKPQILSEPIPGPEFSFPEHFGECGNITSIPFSHLQYVGISNSNQGNPHIIAHLNQFGQWPIIEQDEGILITGYAWD